MNSSSFLKKLAGAPLYIVPNLQMHHFDGLSLGLLGADNAYLPIILTLYYIYTRIHTIRP